MPRSTPPPGVLVAAVDETINVGNVASMGTVVSTGGGWARCFDLRQTTTSTMESAIFNAIEDDATTTRANVCCASPLQMSSGEGAESPIVQSVPGGHADGKGGARGGYGTLSSLHR